MRNRLHAGGAWLVLALMLALAGCAAKGPPPPKVTIQKIALIPVTSPASFYTKNQVFVPFFPGPAALIGAASNREKSAIFNQKMEGSRLLLGAKLTSALQEELRAAGFEVTVLGNVPRPKDDPEDIDYARLQTREPVLHVWFSDVSMQSGQASSVYLPRMDVTVSLLLKPESEGRLYSETFYYGESSRGNKYWSLPSDPKYSYADFDNMMTRSAEVAESYQSGVQAIAKRIARELRKPL